SNLVKQQEKCKVKSVKVKQDKITIRKVPHLAIFVVLSYIFLVLQVYRKPYNSYSTSNLSTVEIRICFIT
ncbi:hypothetical protein, partial [Prevotella sp.]|uniref:hypothetical protein n=1 Tax=Prevotella sp. TaxID=59823 RepID=UPI00307C5F1F